jgi:hypothetical protein
VIASRGTVFQKALKNSLAYAKAEGSLNVRATLKHFKIPQPE